MLRTFPAAHRKSVKSFASAFAMAIALTGGAVAANASFAVQAEAQEYTDAFVEAYQPAADVVNAEGGDIVGISAQFPSIIALAETPDDKFAVGNMILIAGNKTSTPAWQRQGLELQIASGKVPPENLGQFNWFIGNLAFQMGDYGPARAALMTAAANGWSDPDPSNMIAETYFDQDDISGGISYVINQAETNIAAGNVVPESLLLRGLQNSYDLDLLEESTELSVLLLSQHPTEENWLKTLQVIHVLGDFEDQTRLDLLRLMRLTNAMTTRNEFVRYIEAADPRIMSNEVFDVLAAGLAAGEFESDEIYYVEVKNIVDDRMADDRADAPSLVAEAETEADGRGAKIAGDVLYSLDDFAGAEAMYSLAIAKGGVDADTVLTRQGITQVQQGNFAGAQATFAQVGGARATVARLWSVYAEAQGS